MLTQDLEDGSDLAFDSGDCLVQRGAVHASRNPCAPVAFLAVPTAGNEWTLPAAPEGAHALA